MSDTEKAWRCLVCGYIHRGPEPPDFCPVCGAGSEDFEEFKEEKPAAEAAASQWECLNCNYIHKGSSPPGICPVCGAEQDRFEALDASGESQGRGDFSGHLVIVGGGIAGVSAAESFRQITDTGSATLISSEADIPYYRLNLTRLLAGEIEPDALPIHPASWYDQNNIDLCSSTEVRSIDTEGKRVELSSGKKIPFDRMIITAGAHPFIPPIGGVHRECVTSLRTLPQVRSILELLKPGMECTVIGGGLLGIEAAGALAARGASVSLLESHDWLMPRQLNRRAGEILEDYITGLGITLLKQARSRELLGDEHIAEVGLEDGRSVRTDMAVICTGIRPNSHLARRIGLDVNKGIIVDNHLASSHPDILAAGDVAEHRGQLYGNWSSSQFQGSIAGMNAAGAASEFGGLPRSNTLKVLGLDMLSIGRINPEDGSFRVYEQEDAGTYYRFIFHDHYLVGTVLLGDTSITAAVKHAVETKTDFSRLLDHGADTADLISTLKHPLAGTQ
jgi:nitrite reductase (NADH) large subunit